MLLGFFGSWWVTWRACASRADSVSWHRFAGGGWLGLPSQGIVAMAPGLKFFPWASEAGAGPPRPGLRVLSMAPDPAGPRPIGIDARVRACYLRPAFVPRP